MSTFGSALIFFNICTLLMFPFIIQFTLTVERDARRGVRNYING